MKIFQSAILKMTAIYSVILLALCIGFSISIYAITVREIDRPRPTPPTSIIIEDNEITAYITARNDQTKQALIGQIIIVDIVIMTIGIIVSYLLARLTMAPIHEAYEAQSRFVSDASHELRTPLTAISMENEVILRDPSATKEDLKNQVASNLEEIKKLQSLTDTLLKLSRSEQPAAEDRAAIIEQITNILVDNAKKYSPKNAKVKITRTKNYIKVTDQGPGISEKDLPHIFERFYRADASRSTSGYGLGLPLAQALAAQIDAHITAENNPKKGATFTIHFS